MKGKFLTIALFILLAGISVSAQTNEQQSFHDYKGILFKISGNGLKEPSYALGTMHTIPGDYVYTIPEFQDIVEGIEQVLCEYDFKAQYKDLKNYNHSRQEVDSLFRRIEAMYVDKHGHRRTFVDDLTFKERDQVKGSLGTWGFKDPASWTCRNMNDSLGVRYLKALMSEINSYGYDFHIWESPIDHYVVDSIAPKHNLKVVSLDKKDAIGRFSNKQKDLDMIWNPKTKRKDYSRYYGDMILSYRNRYGNTLAYSRMYLAKDLSFFRNNLDSDSAQMKERNSWWMTEIPELIQQRPSLIVVGIGHLMGGSDYEGILASLENLGYTIERIE